MKPCWQLPKGWSDDTEKPLLRARYGWSESELIDQTLAALHGVPEAVRDREGGSRDEGRKTGRASATSAGVQNYTREYGAPARAHDAEDVARMLARKRCAGRKGQIDGATFLAALADAPGRDGDASSAVRWTLSTIQAHECALLVTRCGVRHEDLARHIRTLPSPPRRVVRFLNHFAVRETQPEPAPLGNDSSE